MEYVHVPKTDLARNTRRVLREVQRGYTVVIESHGQPEAAIVDIVDYRIQKAAILYFADPQKYPDEVDYSDSALQALPDEQARYDFAIGHYLAVHISIGRLAEMLGISFVDLRMRLARLGVPQRTAPQTLEELREDVQNAIMLEERARESK